MKYIETEVCTTDNIKKETIEVRKLLLRLMVNKYNLTLNKGKEQ